MSQELDHIHLHLLVMKVLKVRSRLCVCGRSLEETIEAPERISCQGKTCAENRLACEMKAH